MAKHKMRRKIMRQLIHRRGQKYFRRANRFSQRSHKEQHTQIMNSGVAKITSDRVVAVLGAQGIKTHVQQSHKLQASLFAPIYHRRP